MTTTTDLDLVPLDGITTTNIGLVIEPDLAFEIWAEAGEVLKRAEGTLMWAVGDWMNYGKTAYRTSDEIERKAPDSHQANKVAASIGIAHQTIWNATSVCSRVPMDLRRPELTFGHHDAVAALHQNPSQQARWLQLAIDEGLSVHELRERIAAGREPKALTDVGRKPQKFPVRFSVTYPMDMEVPKDLMQQAVAYAGQQLHTWLAERGYDTDIAEVL